MNKKSGISACIITFNEEKVIERCLKSVNEIADEIVIVDSYSTDQTKEIALKYNVRFYEHKWNNNYSKARNIALEYANYQWIIFLDADEVLINPYYLKRHLKKNISSSIGGFLIERRDIFIDRETNKTEYTPIGIVRIFRNLPCIKFNNSIHEEVHSSIYKNGFKIISFRKSMIDHLVIDTSEDKLNFKQTKYLQLLNHELQANPNNHWYLYHKAKTLWYFNELEKALEIFRSIRINAKDGLSLASLLNEAIILSLMDKSYESINLIISNKDLIIDQSQAYVILGDLYYKEGLYLSALKHYLSVSTRLIENKDQEYIPGCLFLYKEQKYYKIACCFLSMGKFNIARYFFKKSIRINRNFSYGYYGLALSYLGGYGKDRSKCKKLLLATNQLDPNWSKPLTVLESVESNFDKITFA